MTIDASDWYYDLRLRRKVEANNTLFLDDLLKAFRKQGWAFMDPEEAFADPIFAGEPDGLPAGQSLIWMLARESAQYPRPLPYPAESEQAEKPKLDRLGL